MKKIDYIKTISNNVFDTIKNYCLIRPEGVFKNLNMNYIKLGKFLFFLIIVSLSKLTCAQERGIKELDFLIGKWETREDNIEKGWWETSTREVRYILKGNYIEFIAKSVDSNGREREYNWYINYNKKAKQFEMVSMFSNWYKTQLDVLVWDKEQRKLTIRNKPDSESEFHERYGEIVFNEDFDEYTWTGENKYGDSNNPSIWKYIEKGLRTE